ncbi:MAG: TAXI family TRAP transporter solute-binding subunit [Flavobacteriaceae bacterium]
MKALTKAFVLTAVFTMLAGAASAQNILIKTGPTGGVWYPVAAGLASVLQEKAGMNVTVQTGGGVSNALSVASNEGQLGFTTSSVVKKIYEGMDGRPPAKDLRIFGILYNQYYTLSVRADSPVKSIPDLKGRGLVTQRTGSSTEQITRDVLEANGLSYADLNTMNFAGNVGDAVNQVRDGQVDGFSALIAHPASYLLELSSSVDVRIVPLEQAVIEKLADKGYTPIKLKAGIYPWLKEDVPTVNSPVMLVTSAAVPDDVVYAMAKAFFENHDTLVNVHQVLAEFVPENAAASPLIPIHPGALKYYKEVGAIK